MLVTVNKEPVKNGLRNHCGCVEQKARLVLKAFYGTNSSDSGIIFIGIMWMLILILGAEEIAGFNKYYNERPSFLIVLHRSWFVAENRQLQPPFKPSF